MVNRMTSHEIIGPMFKPDVAARYEPGESLQADSFRYRCARDVVGELFAWGMLLGGAEMLVGPDDVVETNNARVFEKIADALTLSISISRSSSTFDISSSDELDYDLDPPLAMKTELDLAELSFTDCARQGGLSGTARDMFMLRVDSSSAIAQPLYYLPSLHHRSDMFCYTCLNLGAFSLILKPYKMPGMSNIQSIVDYNAGIGPLPPYLSIFADGSGSAISLFPSLSHLRIIGDSQPYVRCIGVSLDDASVVSKPDWWIRKPQGSWLISFRIHPDPVLYTVSIARRLKTVDTTQAYLLMSVYGLPASRWEEDRYQDSNRPKSEPLHLPEYSTLLKATRAQNVKPRADKNKLFTCRTVWFNAVGGKPAGMQDDEAIRGAQAWYREPKSA
ncbi:hypothetical protein BU17DRAFT_64187 [Hysterangium stoloniferum]|nr:hypothetical protein BU17DRAFT_64187 [Hysterangium stoloniferum]